MLKSPLKRGGMEDEQSGAERERIIGEVRIDGGELQQVTHEATAGHRMFIAVNILGIGLAVVGAVFNHFEGDGLRSFVMTGLLCAISISGLSIQASSRRQCVAGIVNAQPIGSAVSYRLSPSGIAIQRDVGAGSRGMTWNECSAFDESAHAFLLYTSNIVPEIVYKRAFSTQQVTVIRQRLAANIKRRAAGKALVLALAMGIGVVALGVVFAVAMRAAHH